VAALGIPWLYAHEIGHEAGYDAGDLPGGIHTSVAKDPHNIMNPEGGEEPKIPDKCWCTKIAQLVHSRIHGHSK
jgi:hypothetical protein